MFFKDSVFDGSDETFQNSYGTIQKYSDELDNLNITTYPEAHHSFDRNQELIHVENAYSFTDCRLKLTDETVTPRP